MNRRPCTRCKRRTTHGAYCVRCAETRNEQSRRRRAELIQQGICACCRRNRIGERSVRFCDGCLDRIETIHNQKAKAWRAAGLCADCGEPQAGDLKGYCARHGAAYRRVRARHEQKKRQGASV